MARTWRRRRLEREALASGEAARVWKRLAPFCEDGTPDGDQFQAKVREMGAEEEDRAVECIQQADTPWYKRRPVT